jgi:hypothetical protein
VPVLEIRQHVSLRDSTAETMNTQPSAASSGKITRRSRMCSTLAVQSKLSAGNSSCMTRTIASEWPGPFRRSGSPNVMWRAPERTRRRMSARTIPRGTTKNRPP